MAKIKMGTPTGQVDANYRTIKIGDELRNRDNGLTYTVNSYGRLAHGSIIVKKWRGEDHTITKAYPVTSVPKVKGIAKEPKEEFKEEAKPVCAEEVMPEIIPASVPTGGETAAQQEMENLTKRLGEYEVLANEAIEELTKAKAELNELREQGISIVPDKELAEELRRRGYEVLATKTITVEL